MNECIFKAQVMYSFEIMTSLQSIPLSALLNTFTFFVDPRQQK